MITLSRLVLGSVTVTVMVMVVIVRCAVLQVGSHYGNGNAVRREGRIMMPQSLVCQLTSDYFDCD